MGLVAETIAIGDELLTGKISDTNSTFVAAELFSLGIFLNQTTVIPDRTKTIEKVLIEASRRADMVICFGGLGPTSDDLTVDCVATLLDSEVDYHSGQKEKLIDLYTRLGREVSEASLRQVRYPVKADAFSNEVGLAPGFHCEIGSCLFFFLPGVPSEMRPMVKGAVRTAILGKMRQDDARIESHFWRCLGIPESELQRAISEFEDTLPSHAWLGFRTSYPENQLLLYYRLGPSSSEKEFEALQSKVRQIVAPYCYTETYDNIEQTVVEVLKSQKKTVALAESCTGGLATHRLTRIPGSSDVVWGGLSVYQLAAKKRLLELSLENEAAAVTPACSLELATRLRSLSQCDVAGGITGYMGPTGGSEQAPIGTAFVSVVNGQHNLEKKFVLSRPNRERRQWGASTFFLDQIRRALI